MNSLEALDYLAWMSRVNLFGDFVDKFEAMGIELFSWSSVHAKITAIEVYEMIKKRGLVETYQEYIQDKELTEILGKILDSH